MSRWFTLSVSTAWNRIQAAAGVSMLFPVPSRKRAIFLRLLRWRILLRSVHIFDRPNVRRVFRKHAGKWIPVLWGSGLAMLAIALALESLHLPIWPAIVLSYILFAAAMC